MSIFGGRRPEPVPAELGDGFWITEAPALQRTIRNALKSRERSKPTVPAELTFEPGRGRVVAIWRNQLVGFVPDERSADLQRQLDLAGRARLTGPAEVHQVAGEWRIWAGPWPQDELPPPYPAGRIAPAPRQIFGIQLNDRRDRG